MQRKAIFLLYRVLQALLSPFVLFYLLFRGRKYWPTLPERFGFLPSQWQQTGAGAIWLHAVSVGEVLAAVPLIEQITKRSQNTPIFLSVSTLAGKKTAEKRLDIPVFFAPLDYVWAVRRVLRTIMPTVVVVMETEIWPNLFREANRLGCGLMVVNGRISDKALPKYQRYRWFFGPVLRLCDRILAQSEVMAERFGTENASVGGNLKYDFAIPESSFVLPEWPGKTWIAASTHPGEEEFGIAAQKQLSGWRLVLAPRKPERFDEVAGKLTGMRWSRRSAPDPNSEVILLDSIGELSGLFGACDVVFMGGTLAEIGGHNILEPAVFGKPIIAGPHLENFRDIEEHFEKHNALLRIRTGEELAAAILSATAEMGERGRIAAETKRGATLQAADAVMELYTTRYPEKRPPQPVYGLLWTLSLIWKAGSAWDRHRKRARRRKLPVPVISVGNITAGGTGKTPMIIELLRDFAMHRPGLLTRGHGRSTREIVLVLDSQAKQTVERTGDEALLCAKASSAPVGVGGDRYKTGLELIGAANPGALFLDDGFQHLQLERDFDLVLIDALNPFGGGHLLPLGRLREPMEGLARADAFVITRSAVAPDTQGIEHVLRQYNPTAPVFRSWTAPERWVGCDGRGREPDQLNEDKAFGFCGLGNPESYWKSLQKLGVVLLDQVTYDDHHRYTPSELRRLARRAKDIGATALVTTAKDVVNLHPDFRAIIAPLKLFWLEIRMEIENREELIRLIDQELPSTAREA